MMDLSRFRGRDRLLLIFAPSASDEGYARQRDLLERHEVGFADRDLLALHLLEDGSGSSSIGEPVAPEQAAAGRREFGVGDGLFAAVLVGRDCDVKFRSDEPVPAPDLFARVDATPMRRREMREKGRR